MHFMLIALISVLGSALVGIIGVLLHHLLKQNAQRAEEHTVVMAAIAKQGIELREHADGLHREAMAAIAKQGERIEALHDRMVELHLQAMAAVAVLGERTAVLETRTGSR